MGSRDDRLAEILKNAARSLEPDEFDSEDVRDLLYGDGHLNLQKKGIGDAGAMALAYAQQGMVVWRSFNRHGGRFIDLAMSQAFFIDLADNMDIGWEGAAELMVGRQSIFRGILKLDLSCDASRRSTVLLQNLQSANTTYDDTVLQLGRLLSGVKRMHLNDGYITDGSAVALATAIEQNGEHLLVLDLYKNKIRERGGVALAKALESDCLQKLCVLSLGRNKIGVEAAVALAGALERGGGSRLRDLHLEGNVIGNTGAVALAGALERGGGAALRRLRLGANDIGKEGAEALSDALEGGGAAQLQDLDLSLNRIEAEGAIAVARALKSKKGTQLRVLNLAGNRIGSKGAEALAGALGHGRGEQMRDLNLWGNEIGKDGAVALAGALERGGGAQLHVLGLGNNEIGNEGFRALAGALKGGNAPQLRDFDLSDNRMGAAGAGALADALEHGGGPQLRVLNLERNQMGTDGTVALAKAFEGGGGTQLRVLILRKNGIGTKGTVALAGALGLGKAAQLRVLTLAQNGIETEGAMALADALKRGGGALLHVLGLGINNIGTKGFVALADALKCGGAPQLRELDLSFNEMGAEGAVALAGALEDGGGARLRVLNLGRNEMGTKGAIALAGALKSGKGALLRVLILSNNGIGTEGTVALAGALKGEESAQLRILTLAQNGIGVAGAVALASLLEHPGGAQLKRLDLSWNQIRSSGAAALAGSLERGGGAQLWLLALSRNRILTGGAEALAGALEKKSRAILEVNLRDNDVGSSGIINFFAVVALSQHISMDFDMSEEQEADALRWLEGEREAVNNKLLYIFKDMGRRARVNFLLQRNRRAQRILNGLGGEMRNPTDGKTFFIGDPGVGKTTLRESLEKCEGQVTASQQKRGFRWYLCFSQDGKGGCSCPGFCKRKKDTRTRGIEVSQVRVRGLRISLWDMAGQEEFRVSHANFLADASSVQGKATLCLLVVKGDLSPDARKQAKHWLRFIASSCTPTAKREVLVVLNRWNGEQNRIREALWKTFTEELAEEYKDRLAITPSPIVLDARQEVGALLRSLEELIRTMLKKSPKSVPETCDFLLDNLMEWRIAHSEMPMLTLDQFEKLVAKALLGNAPPAAAWKKQLMGAVQYLHEIGEVVFLKRPKGMFVVLNPDWICHKVVGELLLPPSLRPTWEPTLQIEEGAVLIADLERWYSVSLRLNNSGGPAGAEIVEMLESMRLCYRIRGGEKVFIPALLEPETGEAVGTEWARCNGRALVGRRLTCKDEKRTILAASFFHMLQAELSAEAELGQYQAGKGWALLKVQGMAALLQYDDSRDYCIDVLVKHISDDETEQSQARSRVLAFLKRVVQQVHDICSSDWQGVELRESVIVPWEADEALMLLQARTVKEVETLKSELKEEGSDATCRLVGSNGGAWVKVTDLLFYEEVKQLEEEMETGVQGLEEWTASELELTGLGFEENDLSHLDRISSRTWGCDGRQMVHMFKVIGAALVRDVTEPILQRMSEQHTELLERLGGLQRSLNDMLEQVRDKLWAMEKFTEERKNLPGVVFVSKETAPGWGALARLKDLFEEGIDAGVPGLTEKLNFRFLCDGVSASQLHIVDGVEGLNVAVSVEWVAKAEPWLKWGLWAVVMGIKVGLTPLQMGLENLVPSDLKPLLGHSWTEEIRRTLDDSLGELVSLPDRMKAAGGSLVGGQLSVTGSIRDAMEELFEKVSLVDLHSKLGLRRYKRRMDGHVVWLCDRCQKEHENAVKGF